MPRAHAASRLGCPVQLRLLAGEGPLHGRKIRRRNLSGLKLCLRKVDDVSASVVEDRKRRALRKRERLERGASPPERVRALC